MSQNMLDGIGAHAMRDEATAALGRAQRNYEVADAYIGLDVLVDALGGGKTQIEKAHRVLARLIEEPDGRAVIAATRYVESPDEWSGGDLAAVFLAGGITGCPDWQAEARRTMSGVVVLNPRRADFPIHDPDAARGQIEWEYRHLHRARVVLFWFPACESPQPIALYELGRHAALGRPIAVGVEEGYIRAADVRIQLELARPDIRVFGSLGATCAKAIALANGSARD
jgi:hypothetical protein